MRGVTCKIPGAAEPVLCSCCCVQQKASLSRVPSKLTQAVLSATGMSHLLKCDQLFLKLQFPCLSTRWGSQSLSVSSGEQLGEVLVGLARTEEDKGAVSDA